MIEVSIHTLAAVMTGVGGDFALGVVVMGFLVQKPWPSYKPGGQ
jgi:hypothetical protein